MPDPVLRLPYPGLRSFRREESDLFFGRENCINAIVDRLAATRFLAVLGSSGAGKSSVVKTGLLDALDLGLMPAAGSTWRIVDFKPGGAPLQNLALRLLETESQGADSSHGTTADDAALLRAFLLRGPRSVVEWCSEGHLAPKTNLLLLVDQFEELFRYEDYAGREEAEGFVALLLESAQQAQVPIYVALTMRSEYLGACALIDGLAEAISAGMVLIPRMTREQCRSAIVGPAAVCGFKIADDLINRLLNDLATFAPWEDRGTRDQLDRLARRADQLPLLQYCLNRMWVNACNEAVGDTPIVLTLVNYERIGGLAGALNAHANEVLRQLGEEYGSFAEAVFRALTDGSSASDAVRRPTPLRELVEICDGDEVRVHRVIDVFRSPECNFLAPELDPRNPRPLSADTIIDISHESLMRQWEKLSEWIKVEADARRDWRRLLYRAEKGVEASPHGRWQKLVSYFKVAHEPLKESELKNVQAWRRERKLSSSWARRYGPDFVTVLKFIENSERRRRRLAPAYLAGSSCGILFFCSLVIAGIGTALDWLFSTDPPRSAVVLILSAGGALSCAYGLAKYGGQEMRRAWLAGAAIFVAEFSGFVFADLVSRSYPNFSFFWWVTLAGPIVVTIIARFDPRFRNSNVWMLLVGTFNTVVLVSHTNPLGFFVGWPGWFAVLGFQLAYSAEDPYEILGRRGTPGSLELQVLAFLTLGTIKAWTDAILGVVFNWTQPQWWALMDLATIAVSSAITFGSGLRRYRGLELSSAKLAGLTIFVMVVASIAGAIAILSSYNVTMAQVFPWVDAVLYAPCVLFGLAMFDRAFRDITTSLVLAALFLIPCVAGIAIADLFSGDAQERFLIIAGVIILWSGAVGYSLQNVRDNVIRIRGFQIQDT